MKYAIVSDIHGNLPALELVMADALQRGANAFLFAGDYCTSAPWGDEVVSTLRTAFPALCVRGNEENHLRMPPGTDGQFAVTYWSASKLSAENRSWLDALPERVNFTCDGVAIHMTHSSAVFIGNAEHEPFRTSLLPLRYPDGPVNHEDLLQDIYRTLDANPAFHETLRTLPAGVYIFGHSHSQWHARFGNHLFINPGSCGLPLECGAFGAPYTLLTIENGQCSVEERRIPYDREALIAQVKQTDQYNAARVWSEVIFREWRTCREHVIFFLRHAEKYARRIGDERRPFAPDTWEAAYEEWAEIENPHMEAP
ncbi:MAG: metallophosphoesterase family protein [Clostridia bacterium]|nr:metallophosphoesterase family protein [Clostridia bacterium]